MQSHNHNEVVTYEPKSRMKALPVLVLSIIALGAIVFAVSTLNAKPTPFQQEALALAEKKQEVADARVTFLALDAQAAADEAVAQKSRASAVEAGAKLHSAKVALCLADNEFMGDKDAKLREVECEKRADGLYAFPTAGASQ